MATLAVQQLVRSGLNTTYAAATGGGDKFAPSARTFLHCKNAGGGAITLTVVTPNTLIADVTIADLAVSVPAAGERMIGPFPYEHFANAADGLADITYSGVTSVTLAAVQLSAP